MKVFLAGGSGMVGSNILEHKDADQFEFLSPSSKELNLLDYSAVSAYIGHCKPDLIIHAAGTVGGIQANMANPVLFLVNNTDMGRNVIMAARQHHVKKLINLASSCMYPRNVNGTLSEDMILKGELEPTNEGYALAKILSTKLCEYISKEKNGFEYKTLIPCNLYGRFDKFSAEHSHLIPAVIRKVYEAKMQNKAEIDIWGDGTARREFMYSGDLADFIFFAITNFDKIPQNINVGPGFDYTVNEYYEEIAKIVGYEGKFVHDLSRPIGMQQKLINDSKLKELGWKTETSLSLGIEKTVEFFKNKVLND